VKSLNRAAALMGMLLATACSDKAAPPTASAGALRQEGFCQLDGLAPALRHSIVMLDERSLTKAEGPAAIRAANAELFSIALALGDPGQAVTSGVMAPRERLSIYVAPADGAAPRLIFTGCIPGVSAAEAKALAARKSNLQGAADSYFGGSINNKIEEASGDFRQALLGSIVTAAQNAGASSPSRDLLTSSIVRSMRSVRQIAPPEQGLPRLFVLTSLAMFSSPAATTPATARAAGFAAADEAHLLLGRAEVHLLGRKPGDALAREFADAFVLGSQGALESWGSTTFNNAAAAPVRVNNYAGKIDYGGIEYPAQLRVAVDRNGSLVDSWITVKLAREYATPVTGAMSCDADGVCKLTSDDHGFAQVWSADPDPEPEFDADMPLGGLRYIEAEIADGKATGKVFDPSVDVIGSLPGSVGLRFEMTTSR
jgi:hypothetical protein